MRVSLIVAASRNNVIGRGGRLPWHLSSDLKRFRELTMNHAIIMGRRTWESIGRPLPGRVSIVLTRQHDWRPAGALVASELDEALDYVTRTDLEQDEAFVIGGAAIYSLALDRAERIYFTRVEADVDGDVVLPPIDWSDYSKIDESSHLPSERDEYATTFEVWERNAAAAENDS